MKKERIFWGVFLILGAVFILAAKLGFMQGIGVWSLIWTVLFAAILIKSLIKLNFFGMFISVAFLAIIYAEPLRIEAITPWPVLGAAVLLGIGFAMIFPKKHFTKFKNTSFQFEGDHVEGREKIINEADGASCGCSVHFGSAIKYINSDSFESASFEASFGGLKVYFDNAVMKGAEAHVYLENSFAGTELYIPKSWRVVESVSNSFAGIDEKGHAQPDGLHTLYLHGDNSFGGITIIYI